MTLSKIFLLSLIIFSSCKSYENKKKINQLTAGLEVINAQISDLQDLNLEKHQELDSLKTNIRDQERAAVALQDSFELYATINKKALAYINTFDNPIDILKDYAERNDNQIGFMVIAHVVLLNFGLTHKAYIDSVRDELLVFDRNKKIITLTTSEIQHSIDLVQSKRNEIDGEITVLEGRKNELTMQIAALNTTDASADTEKKEWRSPATFLTIGTLLVSLFGNLIQRKHYLKEKKRADEESARAIALQRRKDEWYVHLKNELTLIEKKLQEEDLTTAEISAYHAKKDALLKQLTDFMSAYT